MKGGGRDLFRLAMCPILLWHLGDHALLRLMQMLGRLAVIHGQHLAILHHLAAIHEYRLQRAVTGRIDQAAPLAPLGHQSRFVQQGKIGCVLRTINAKMEKYGATLMGMQGLKVTYVNHCAFYQGPALHMVFQGKMGPVTLFLVPKHLPDADGQWSWPSLERSVAAGPEVQQVLDEIMRFKHWVRGDV